MTAALSIFYGPLIDKHSFKQTALGAIFLQAFWLFLLFFSMFLPNYFLILNCILAILISICDEFYSPADRAILKQSVKLNVDLTNMIAKISFIDQSVNFFGIALAGILLKFISSNYIILICAFLSLLSGGLLFNSLKKVHLSIHKQIKRQNYFSEILIGYHYIKKEHFLSRYFFSSILFSFVEPALIVFLPYTAEKLGSASYLSFFYMSFFLGFIVGVIICKYLKTTSKNVGLIWILSIIPLLFLINNSNWLIFCFLISIFGTLTGIHNILGESLMQITSTEDILGRVMTTIRTANSLGSPIGSVVAGIILDKFNQNILLVICCIFIFLGGINIIIKK